MAYVPAIDEIQEQLNNSLPGKYEKLTMPNSTTFNFSVWYSGMPEQFLNYVKQALNVVKRTGLVDTYYSAHKKDEKEKVVTDIVMYKE